MLLAFELSNLKSYQDQSVGAPRHKSGDIFMNSLNLPVGFLLLSLSFSMIVAPPTWANGTSTRTDSIRVSSRLSATQNTLNNFEMIARKFQYKLTQCAHCDEKDQLSALKKLDRRVDRLNVLKKEIRKIDPSVINLEDYERLIVNVDHISTQLDRAFGQAIQILKISEQKNALSQLKIREVSEEN